MVKTMPMFDDDSCHRLRKRLQLQSQRRGMRELDLILGDFANAYLPTLSEDKLRNYDAFLQQSEHVLFHILVEGKDDPSVGARFQELIDLIRAHRSVSHCSMAH